MFKSNAILFIKIQSDANRIVGIYSSIDATKKVVGKFDKGDAFIAYKIPLNELMLKSDNADNDLSKYFCHYFGTFEETTITLTRPILSHPTTSQQSLHYASH